MTRGYKRARGLSLHQHDPQRDGTPAGTPASSQAAESRGGGLRPGAGSSLRPRPTCPSGSPSTQPLSEPLGAQSQSSLHRTRDRDAGAGSFLGISTRGRSQARTPERACVGHGHAWSPRRCQRHPLRCLHQQLLPQTHCPAGRRGAAIGSLVLVPRRLRQEPGVTLCTLGETDAVSFQQSSVWGLRGPCQATGLNSRLGHQMHWPQTQELATRAFWVSAKQAAGQHTAVQ